MLYMHRMRSMSFICLLIILSFSVIINAQDTLTYPIVDTNQTHCATDSAFILCGGSFNGQDAQYEGLQPSYQVNGDGTVTDLNTGLMWSTDPGSKQAYYDAVGAVASFNLAGYTDWRVPTIKELYSLIDFSGRDVSGSFDENNAHPFMNDDVFAFQYGDESAGERTIDSQWVTSSIYVDTVMGGSECFFGVNFADGRIKCYPTQTRSGGYFAIYVRGGNGYGVNNYVDNGNGTITDNATGLTWMQADSGQGVLWSDALNYCEGLSLAGNDNWRLPDAKELHSIFDYNRSPSTTNSAAIDPIFSATPITNEAGQADYGFYWTSTTHIGDNGSVANAVYMSFGRALGNMDQFGGWIDVHGAGAQRSDPKAGVPESEVNGHGPQGDARRSFNYVRCVSGGIATPSAGEDPSNLVFNSSSMGQPPQGDNSQGQGGQGQGQQPPQGDNTQGQGGQGQQPPQGNNTQGQGGQGQPPQAAFDACSSLAQNASCSVNTPNGTLTGTCQSVSNQLACVPNP